MLVGKRLVVNLPPGVNKNDNSYTSLTWSDANRVRFFKGFPQKIGGWLQIAPNTRNSQPIQGLIRSLFSWRTQGGIENIMIGSHYGLYVFVNSQILNITPLQTSAISPALAANPFTTYFETLINNPLSVSNGSQSVTMDITAFPTSTIFQVNDSIKIAGSSALGNIPAGNINGVRSILAVTATTITFGVATPANANYTGGGNAITVATQVVTLAYPANTLMNGDRIKITGATGFNGFVAGDLNGEHIVRNVTAGTADFYVSSNNFSNAAGTGGGTIALFLQIAPSNATFSYASGYGGGPYGAGPYGVGKRFTNGYRTPTIWSFDLFGTGIVLTPGNQTPLYTWDGNTAIAPVALSAGGVPTAINYVFTSHGQAVVFGAGNVPNQINTSNTADLSNWVPGPTTTAFEATIPGATILIGRSFVRDQEVLFTQNAVYSFNYVGLPIIWEVNKICESDGLIGPRAVASINDLVFWMGNNDFYIYNGAVYSIIPNNTVKNWVFQNMNWATSYLCFIRSCLEFNEVWFFFPYGNSPECNAYVIYNFEESTWTNGFLTRTASEEPSNEARPQYMATSSVPIVLGSNPISVVNASNIATIDLGTAITFFDTNMYVNISGVTGTIGGISAATFNNIYRINSIQGNSITITLPTNAGSTASGGGNPKIAIASNLYQHEVQYGDGDENTPFLASLTTSYALIDDGDYIQQISRVVPSTDILYDMDFDLGDVLYQLSINTKLYDGDTIEITNGPYDITFDTNKIDLRALGRQRKYVFSSYTSLPFRIQKWFEEIKQSTPR